MEELPACALSRLLPMELQHYHAGMREGVAGGLASRRVIADDTHGIGGVLIITDINAGSGDDFRRGCSRGLEALKGDDSMVVALQVAIDAEESQVAIGQQRSTDVKPGNILNLGRPVHSM